MTFKKIILSALIMCFTISFAQTDTKAEDILKKLEAEFDGTTVIAIDFNMILVNTEADLKQHKRGRLIVSNEQFDLRLDDIQVICDGKTKWTIMAEDEMIQISAIDEEDEEENFNLKEYFSGYKEKFSYSMKDSKKPLHLIELIPTDETLETARVLVSYNDDLNRINQITEENKQGTQTVFNILSYEKQASGDHSFSPDMTLYADFEIDDLR